MQPIITSLQHPDVKLVRSLDRRKKREELGLFAGEGVRFVEEACRAAAPIVKAYYTAALEHAARGTQLLTAMTRRGIPLQEVSSPVMTKMAATEQPQGILVTIRTMRPGPLQYRDIPLVVVCDKIQDPGNLGTIIRTADAAGADALFTVAGTVDLYNAKVMRATMGSIFHLPVYTDLSGTEILQKLHKCGISVVGATLKAEDWHFNVDYRQPVAIWLGNESFGIEDAVLQKLDVQAKIPLEGCAESLNVSVAAAIIIYECVRQRMTVKLP